MTFTVVCIIAFRSNDPVLPAEVTEGNVKVLESAPGIRAYGAVCDFCDGRVEWVRLQGCVRGMGEVTRVCEGNG